MVDLVKSGEHVGLLRNGELVAVLVGLDDVKMLPATERVVVSKLGIGERPWAPAGDDPVDVLDRYNGIPTMGVLDQEQGSVLFWQVWGYAMETDSLWLYVGLTSRERRAIAEMETGDPVDAFVLRAAVDRDVTLGVAYENRLLAERSARIPAGSTASQVTKLAARAIRDVPVPGKVLDRLLERVRARAAGDLGSSGGVELTDEIVESLAVEAESGFDLERLRPRADMHPDWVGTHPVPLDTRYPTGVYTGLVVEALGGVGVQVDDAWCGRPEEPGDHGGPTIRVDREDDAGGYLGAVEYTWIADTQEWRRVSGGASYGFGGWLSPGDLAGKIRRDVR